MSAVRRHAALLLAVVLLLGAGLAFWQADRARDKDNVGNVALVDDARTEEVQGAVQTGLLRALSFDYDNPEATDAAADQVLRGDARKEYDTLFATLRDKAPDQKIKLVAKIRTTAVQELKGDRARLLVFLDQAAQRAGDEESSWSAAQVSVDAEVIDGEWRITGLRVL